MNNYPNIPILIFAGVITEDNIKKIIATQNNITSEAKIIELEDEDLRLWFVKLDEAIPNMITDEYQLFIEAYDNGGNVVWEDIFYN